MWWHHFLFCFCFSAPQFDQDNLKKSLKPSRLEDIHGFHRGRRQSGQGQSPFYYWEDQSINHSINQSIDEPQRCCFTTMNTHTAATLPEFFERWKQIFVTCFKDLSRFKYRVGSSSSFPSRLDRNRNTSPDLINKCSESSWTGFLWKFWWSSGGFSFSGTAERSCESHLAHKQSHISPVNLDFRDVFLRQKTKKLRHCVWNLRF